MELREEQARIIALLHSVRTQVRRTGPNDDLSKVEGLVRQAVQECQRLKVRALVSAPLGEWELWPEGGIGITNGEPTHVSPQELDRELASLSERFVGVGAVQEYLDGASPPEEWQGKELVLWGDADPYDFRDQTVPVLTWRGGKLVLDTRRIAGLSASNCFVLLRKEPVPSLVP